ncbi:MAG: AraC family transcriptional regulator [Prevotella sp.]|nr:AraC family transcriptional regulator [Prevotella sp.]
MGNDAIASQCGFADRTVFQRTFKKMVGITPAQYMEHRGI